MRREHTSIFAKHILLMAFLLISAAAADVLCQTRKVTVGLYVFENNDGGKLERTIDVPFIDPVEFCTTAEQKNNLKLQAGKTYRFVIKNPTSKEIYVSIVQDTPDSNFYESGEFFFSEEIKAGESYESEIFKAVADLRVVASDMRFDDKAVSQEAVGSVRGAEGLTNFASIAAVAGSENTDYRKLIGLYRKTLSESPMLPKSCRVRVYNSLGVAHLAVSEFSEAISAFKSGLEHSDNEISHLQKSYDRMKAAIYNNLGLTYSALNLFDLAAENYKQALILKKKLEDWNGLAITSINLGVTSLVRKQATAAENDFNEALKFNDRTNANETLPDKRQREQRRGLIISGLARVKSLHGKHRESIELSEDALKIAKTNGNRAAEGFAYNNIGAAFRQLNDSTKAVENYAQALIVFREVENRAMEGIVLSNLMSAYRQQGFRKTAVFYGKQAINSFQKLRAELNRGAGDLERVFLKSREDVYRKLADILIEEGFFFQARQVLKMLKTEEYADFVRRDASEMNSAEFLRLIEDEESKKLIEEYNKIAGEISAAGRKWTILYKKQSEGELSVEEQKRYDELNEKLQLHNRAMRLFLEKGLIESLKDTAKKESAERIIKLDRALQEDLRLAGDGTVALHTIIDEDKYRVILTTPALQSDFKTVIERAELNKKIYAFYDALNDPRIDPRPLGKDLYEILFPAGLIKALDEEKAKTLVWSLDGQLRYIPLAALSPDGKSYLAEKYQNVIVTSMTRSNLAFSGEDWRVLGMGVSDRQSVAHPVLPDKQITFEKLDAVETELRKIVRSEAGQSESGYFSGNRFMNAEFVKDVFTKILTKRENNKRKYTVVHFATHFYLGDNDKDSFLLLGGGQKMLLADFAELQGVNFNGVELVTLSACNTGFGRDKDENSDRSGKEIDSLAAFIEERSAKAVMATLWAVADESTALFMSEFYRQKKENPNMTKAEAMQKAQLEMIGGSLKPGGTNSGCRSEVLNLDGTQETPFKCKRDAPFSHPFFWSPFVLIGNWR